MGVINMDGEKYGNLTAIRREPNDKYGNARWLFQCDCGKEIILNASRVRTGHTKSCGHLQREVASKLNSTHKMSKTKIFKAWAGMKQRCENPNSTSFSHYGERGITICPEWHIFENFYEWAKLNGYKPGLTIERKDNNKGYTPENCIFTTRAEQNRNTTRTHRILFGDKYITAAQSARIAGLSRSTVAKWARNGLVHTIDDVIRLEQQIKNPRHIPRRCS